MSENKNIVQLDNISQDDSQLNQSEKVLYYSAPLPPAAELQRYETILPGAADRIMKMVE